jgi:hypothetical protein
MTMTQPLVQETDDPILFKMMAEERGGGEVARTSLMLGLICTIVLSVLAGLLVTVLFMFWFASSLIGSYGWIIFMLVASAGICFWLDKTTRGKRWADAQIAGPVLHPLLDKLLFAHRFTVGGIQRKQNASASIDTMVIERGARLVRTLGTFNEPKMPAHLLEQGDSPAFLDHVIAHLSRRDWIGHSSDGQKLWLSSRAKNLLAQWGMLGAN